VTDQWFFFVIAIDVGDKGFGESFLEWCGGWWLAVVGKDKENFLVESTRDNGSREVSDDDSEGGL